MTRIGINGKFIRMATSADLGPLTFLGWSQFRPNNERHESSADNAPFGTNTGPVDSVPLGVRSICGALRTELAHAGGRVQIYDGFSRDGEPVTLSAWVGEHHAAWRFHYQPEDSVRDVLAHYRRLQLTDARLGLTVKANGFEGYNVRSYVNVPDVGLMSIHPADDATTLVPRSKGAKAPAGEMWRMPTATPESGEDGVMLATPSAVVRILPSVSPAARTDRSSSSVADFAQKLVSVTWDS